ncbi:putative Diguanylate cyclase [Catenovulum agarivorans DS-2]|uniref:Putative Diguanylate cyclase n=1 Tax=Catenovulum agarivorans DS-2 TaxID=1328313 RepID=W7QN19_9ALTE|nr:EAL domain-containing protein [Catenovulum agarivorans]EWH10347.1 putative Diguanylate cyclase [Catenovulum agarivorans DS-2]
MNKKILPPEFSSTNFGVREELTSFLINYIEGQGGFYVLFDSQGSAVLSSSKLPTELTPSIREILNFNAVHKIFGDELSQHKSVVISGYQVTLNEVYHQDEMFLILLGIPETHVLSELYNAFPIGVMKADHLLHLKFCNTHCYELFGLSNQELYGRKWINALDTESRDKIFSFFSDTYNNPTGLRVIAEVITPLGKKRILSIAIHEQIDLVGNILGYHIMLQDISKEYAESNYLKHLATHDSLTQLLNRSSLISELEVVCAEPLIQSSCALLFIDLDKFKYINDTLGHHIGDELLVVVAKRLLNVTRTDDLVARIGGDEFIVLLKQVESIEIAYERTQAIANNLNKPVKIDQQQINVHLSIGLTMGQDIIDSFVTEDAHAMVEHWLNASDSAMYKAKAQKGHQIVLYNQELSSELSHILNIQSAIEKLLQTPLFESYFQPILTKEAELYSLEALCRFSSPALMNLSEAFGHIKEHKRSREILQSIVENNVASYAQIVQATQAAHIGLNLNIELQLLHSGNFSHTFLTVLAKHGVKATQVTIEITEQDTYSHIEDVVFDNLNLLREHGVKIALDDFGTGYSSVERLLKLGFNQLKIDKIFLSENLTRQQKKSALQASAQLGKALNLQLVVEGIETEEDAQLCQDSDIELFQGYFFAKPMQLNQIIEYIGQTNESA